MCGTTARQQRKVPVEVDGYDVVPVVQAHIGHRLVGQVHGRVIHQDIDASEALRSCVDHRGDVRLTGNIGLHSYGGATGGGDLGDHLVARRPVPPRHHHLRAFPRQRDGYRPAYAAAASGDYGHSVL